MRILLIEDDETLCETLKYQLEKENLSVDTSMDGYEGLELMKTDIYDLVLLDRMLPSMDGIQILSIARKAQIQTPVIMLTALGELEDKIVGLDHGADDYLVKPFAFQELMARIRSISRRAPSLIAKENLVFGDLSYDTTQHLLSCNGIVCTLSKKEGDLMELFLHNHGQILPRATILLKVWGPEGDVEDGNLDNYIHFLRRRLRTVKSQVTLSTVRGVGYRLEEPDV